MFLTFDSGFNWIECQSSIEQNSLSHCSKAQFAIQKEIIWLVWRLPSQESSESGSIKPSKLFIWKNSSSKPFNLSRLYMRTRSLFISLFFQSESSESGIMNLCFFKFSVCWPFSSLIFLKISSYKTEVHGRLRWIYLFLTWTTGLNFLETKDFFLFFSGTYLNMKSSLK